MGDDEVKKLADTLKKQGLAVSTYEAMEKAKSILNIGSQKSPDKQEGYYQEQKIAQTPDEANKEQSPDERIFDDFSPEQKTEKFSKPDYDITKESVSLNELMGEIGVTEEQIAEQEKEKIGRINEEISKIRENITEAGNNPEKSDEIRQEISGVNEQIDELIEEKSA